MIARLLIVLVKGYRLFLSPALGSSCRFEPTCSAYALQALENHGAGKGAYLTLKRIGRCHPWCEGGLDPVPQPGTSAASHSFSRLISTSSEKKSS
ncbi:MAG: membrane protein insertion efficiency factor YidD [Rhodoferax ferrireducens]|uniref:Putative membrane protein insertion efficiency factor n=1 Tax=Rhodoferax ferrireducens TaxID=192843 RepID=A0A1W9KQM4_9BURK|nr:MAG: membrane protein insertion efficiency factor YidD [Rhodoferax ferrireducens]